MDGAGTRGQILVIGAVAIALVLVGLGVVLNSVLYADTQAAQERATSGGDTLRFQQSLDNAIGGSIFYANYDDHESYATLLERVENGTQGWVDR
ncbi:hypothetical protein [Natronomonas sp.]